LLTHDDSEELVLRSRLLDLIENSSSEDFNRLKWMIFEAADPENKTGWKEGDDGPEGEKKTEQPSS